MDIKRSNHRDYNIASKSIIILYYFVSKSRILWGLIMKMKEREERVMPDL